MMKKEEMAERLRDFLDTDIKFEKLTTDDLKKLYNLFDDPENIIEILLDRMGIERFINVTNTVIKKKIIESKPIRKLLKNLLLKE